MSDRKDSYEQKLELLDSADFQRAVTAFREKLDYRAAAYLNSCVHCGLCADSCHYYLTDRAVESIPAHKLNLLLSVFKRYFTPAGKIAPWLTGARELDRSMVNRWIDSLFGRCSLCGRCTLNCSIGIDISGMIRLGRGILSVIDMVPPELQRTVDTAVEKGNNMGIAVEDWLDTVQWLEEELQQEVGDPDARLPVDLKGAEVYYTLNPREPKFFPLSLLATGKIFYAAGERWTFGREHYDVTNYGLFIGNERTAGLISERLVESVKSLGCKRLVLGECGHGFNANRWEAPEWLETEYDFDVKSIISVIADYIRKGQIKLDPSRHQHRVTLHDPCNLVRLGGIIEDQRFILKRTVTEFVEMYPNREQNYCCGGGGGQLSMTRYADRRLKVGKIKAEQIKATGAKIVVAPCHNCIDQLTELNKEYKLGVEIKSLSEMVADALVIEKKTP